MWTASAPLRCTVFIRCEMFLNSLWDVNVVGCASLFVKTRCFLVQYCSFWHFQPGVFHYFKGFSFHIYPLFPENLRYQEPALSLKSLKTKGRCWSFFLSQCQAVLFIVEYFSKVEILFIFYKSRYICNNNDGIAIFIELNRCSWNAITFPFEA